MLVCGDELGRGRPRGWSELARRLLTTGPARSERGVVRCKMKATSGSPITTIPTNTCSKTALSLSQVLQAD